MNQKKNKTILIVTIVLVVVLALLGVLVFATTDVLKSSKTLFFKYGAQMFQESGITSSELVKYFEKQKITPYETDGKFETRVESKENQEEFDDLNKMDITFKGQVDTANNKATQDIQINYTDEVNFPFSYRQTGDILGLQTKYVGKNYIAIDTSTELEGNNGAGSKIINLKEKLNSAKSDDKNANAQKNFIKDPYVNVINQQLTSEMFTKVKSENGKGYKLTLSTEKIKEIYVGLLEVLKDDQETIDLINEFLEMDSNLAKITTSKIEDSIEETNEMEISSKDIEIIVYEKGKLLSGIEIKTDVANVSLNKKQSSDEAEYVVKIGIKEPIENAEEKVEVEEVGTITLIAKYTGLRGMQTVNEDYQIKIEVQEEGIAYTHHYNNAVNFITVADIEDLDDSNSMILNNQSEEEIATLMQAIIERIGKVNEDQMKELGIEKNENPLSKMSFSAYMTMSGSDRLLKAANDAKKDSDEAFKQEMERQEERDKIVFGEYDENTDDEVSNGMDEQIIMAHNKKFEKYAGKIKGVTVKGLLTEIKANNEANKEDAKDQMIKEINFLGEEFEANDQNISSIKEQIDKDKEYRIECEKTEEGIIYRITINEQ